MSDTFDPFSADDGADNQHMLTDTFGGGLADSNFADTTFDESTSFDFAATPMAAVLSGDAAADSGDIDGAFGFGVGAGVSDGGEEDFPAFPSPSRRHMNPVNVSVHEEMSCVHDGISNTSSLSIEGIVSIKSSVALEGKTIALTLNDPEQHAVQKLSYDASIVSDVGTNTGGSKSKHNRVFSVKLPEDDPDFPPNTDIQCIKYTCASSLVPVPVVSVYPLLYYCPLVPTTTHGTLLYNTSSILPHVLEITFICSIDNLACTKQSESCGETVSSGH
jgi:hypothetical protein